MNPRTADGDSLDSTLRKHVDQACTRFEQAWQRGDSPRIEAYLEAGGATARRALFVELFRLERHYRSKAGETLCLDEYRQRFPDYRELIGSTLHDAAIGQRTEGAQPVRQRPPTAFRPGEFIDEFEILSELGKGAFGTVYRAWQHGVDREVALKISSLETHEARTMAPLDGHANIVRIYDQRQLRDRNLHLIYMELVSGVTLRSVIRRIREDSDIPRDQQTMSGIIARCCGQSEGRGVRDSPPEGEPGGNALPAGISGNSWGQQVCQLFAQLGDALDFAHRRGVLHCDIKPANILLDSQGTPKLVDFNIAHHTSLPQAPVGGTLAYMSPEQLDAYVEVDEQLRADKAAKLDGRSDLYSLGLVLWELLTGALPFEERQADMGWTELVAAMAEHRKAGLAATALEALPADLPEGLRYILLRCLAPDPKARYATAGHLAHELRLCAQPEMQDLLFPPKRSWREFVVRWPELTLACLVLLVNSGMSLLSIWYNWAFLRDTAAKSQLDVFWDLILPINIPGFIAGLSAGLFLAWPMTSAIRAGRFGIQKTPSALAVARCLILGHYLALVTLGFWSAASLAWFVLMSRLALGLNIQSLYFAGSVFICGMTSAALSFFAVTFICVRALLPRLLREARQTISNRLEGPILLHLALLILGPFLAVITFVLAKDTVGSSKHLMVCLCIMGIIGIGAGFACSHAVRLDLQILSRLAHARRDGAVNARSSSSSWGRESFS